MIDSVAETQDMVIWYHWVQDYSIESFLIYERA